MKLNYCSRVYRELFLSIPLHLTKYKTINVRDPYIPPIMNIPSVGVPINIYHKTTKCKKIRTKSVIFINKLQKMFNLTPKHEYTANI